MSARARTDDSREFLRHEHADLNHAIEDEELSLAARCDVCGGTEFDDETGECLRCWAKRWPR